MPEINRSIYCRNCFQSMYVWPVELGRPAHYCCPHCQLVVCFEHNYLVECPSPVEHLINPPKWVVKKYAPKGSPLRAHDLKKQGAQS